MSPASILFGFLALGADSLSILLGVWLCGVSRGGCCCQCGRFEWSRIERKADQGVFLVGMLFSCTCHQCMEFRVSDRCWRSTYLIHLSLIHSLTSCAIYPPVSGIPEEDQCAWYGNAWPRPRRLWAGRFCTTRAGRFCRPWRIWRRVRAIQFDSLTYISKPCTAP